MIFRSTKTISFFVSLFFENALTSIPKKKLKTLFMKSMLILGQEKKPKTRTIVKNVGKMSEFLARYYNLLIAAGKEPFIFILVVFTDVL